MQPSSCLLLIDPPAPGDWNMAVDEALLEWAATGGKLVWRFYRWNEPTLSLGYFQQAAERAAHPASGRCPVVRRLSGGGTILHDDELTYSLVVPGDHPLASERERLYDAVHASLIETLAQWQIAATLCDGKPPGPEDATTGVTAAFLCFQRRSPGDVILRGMKIGGSAQRRRERAILQHGSVLLGRSEVAPELPGIAELAGIRIAAEELTEVWLPRLADALGLHWMPGGAPQEVMARAKELVALRYAEPLWTEHRGRDRHAV